MEANKASMLTALVLIASCTDHNPNPTALAVVGGTESSIIHSDASFTSLAPMPLARFGHMSVALNGRVYVIGGDTPEGYTPRVDMYDPNTNTWTGRTPLPGQRVQSQAVVANGKIFVIGGAGNSGYVSTVYVSDDGARTWTTTTPAPIARAHGSAAVVGNKIYVFGGGNAENENLQQTDVFDVETATWTTAAPIQSGCGLFSRAFAVGRKIYVGNVTCNLFQIYDVDLNSWSAGAQHTAYGYFSGGVVDGRIYAIYANSENRFSMGYDPALDTWTSVGTPPAGSLANRSGSATVAGIIYLTGGQETPGDLYNDKVMAYNPAHAGNRRPTARAYGPYQAAEGSVVSFTSSATDPENDALTYWWEFGDGATSSDANPTHTYADQDRYPVSLTVTDAGGRSHTANTYANIRNVRHSVTGITGGTARAGVAFTGSGTIVDPGTNDVFYVDVDWGDGEDDFYNNGTSRSVPLNHVYTTLGYYNLKVTVESGEGDVVVISRWVRVKLPIPE
jgi:PKD repeat protein